MYLSFARPAIQWIIPIFSDASSPYKFSLYILIQQYLKNDMRLLLLDEAGAPLNNVRRFTITRRMFKGPGPWYLMSAERRRLQMTGDEEWHFGGIFYQG